MTDFSIRANLLTMLVEWVAVILLFWDVEKKTEGNSRWLGYLCLGLLTFIYLPIIPAFNATSDYSRENLLNQVLRTGLNWLAVYGYLAFTKEKSRRVCGYLAMLYLLLYMVSFNLRQTFYPFMAGLSQVERENVMLFLLVVFQWGLAYAAYRLLDLNHIRDLTSSRWAIAVIAVLVELYLKWSLIAPEAGAQQRPFDIVFYSLCATLGVFVLVILSERNFTFQQHQNALRMEQMQMQYEMQNAKRALQTNNDIRRLYHDMKNHLLAIQGMTKNGEADAYISELYSQLQDYEATVNTGNSVADSLLSEKIERARLDGIRFNVVADFTPFQFMRSVDLVTILGNSIDNAIEALQMLPEGQDRIIYIKTVQYANMAVLRISNQYAGNLEVKEGRLQTGKADPELHGIGLNSIRKAVKRYSGNVETQFENEEKWFRLLIMIPIPENRADG